MATTKTFLITLTVAVETGDAEPDEGHSEISQLENRLVEAIDQVLGVPRPLGWQALWHTELDPTSTNCGRCVVCSCWVTDRTQPDPLRGLCNGAPVDGQLLCDEHLPDGHRWRL